jgi:hypothetical protein
VPDEGMDQADLEKVECPGFFCPTNKIMSQRSIASNLFGRHLCPFTSGFRKSNGNGLLSAFDSRATLPAL